MFDNTTIFDITTLETVDTTFLHLKSPITEEPMFLGEGEDAKPIGIWLHSPGTEAYEAAEGKRTNRALVRSKRKIDLNADLLRGDTVDFLAEVTASFQNLGYPPAGDAQGAKLYKALYADRRRGWVVSQVQAHLNDYANFTKASATS